MDDVLTLDKQGHVAWLTMNRPDKLNALGPGFWSGMVPAVRQVDEDPDIRVLVFRGAGRAFTAGLDLQTMLGHIPLRLDGPPDGAKAAAVHQVIRDLQQAATCLERCRVPVIAAIHGPCIGGGIDLSTACDIRWCAADATFGVRETRLAMVADLGTLQRLPRVVGPGAARELVYTGRDFDAAYAERIGLVTRVLPDPNALFAAVAELAAEIAAQPPLAVQGAKRVLVEATRHEIDRGLEYVATWNAAHLATRDLMTAAQGFLTRTTPTFEGR